MSSKIVINVTSFETRAAVFEDGELRDVHLERFRDKGLVGNIYLGEVQRVLPGMQAAFVEIGEDKAAFLYVGDIALPKELLEHKIEDDFEDGTQTTEIQLSALDESPAEEIEEVPIEKNTNFQMPAIDTVLKTGQKIIVQVAKDAIGTKGPRVTGHISLSGRYVVFMPTRVHVGISRRIVDEAERERLKQLLEGILPQGTGCVARTSAEGVDVAALKEDVELLHTQWLDIEQRASQQKGRTLIRHEIDLAMKMARDILDDEVRELYCDDYEVFQNLQSFLAERNLGSEKRIRYYDGETPIFDFFGVESELERAMARKVWLKSGGSLVIDEAEALTVIDVNTGKYVGKRNLEETIFKTNIEAVHEIAYQLRLRNIGGIIIIDFIDMERTENQEALLKALEAAFEKDKARCNVERISELGLVEMTRRRTKESIGQRLSEPCWYCEGRGKLKSKRTIAYDIFRTIERKGGRFSEPLIVVNAHPEVVDVICQEERLSLQALERKISKTVIIRPRGSFHQEQFDVFGSNEKSLGLDE